MIPQKLRTNATIFKVLAWIILIFGILGGIGVIIFGIVSGETESTIGLVIMGIVYIVIGVLIGWLYFAIARGIHEKKNWAKTVGFILAILMLFNIPIGTVLGIILLIGFSDEESKAWFSGMSATAPTVAPEPPPPPPPAQPS